MANEFQGVWTALVTPFTNDGAIDWAAFERLLAMQEEAGVKGVVLSGTTGEAPTLTVQEKLALFRKARATLKGSVRVMAGTGGNNTEQSVELSKLAQDAGCDSLLVVTPPYNKPSLAGLKAHFEAISKAVSIPLCLYHVPSRTGQLLSAEQIAEICSVDRVLAVKEASANLELFGKSRLLSGKAFLSGDDATYLPSLAAGGVGVISVTSNIFPKAMVAMTDAFFGKEIEKALKLHDVFLPLFGALFWESNPAPAKALLADMKLSLNTLRLPLVPIQKETHERLIPVFQQAARRLQEMGLSS